MWAVWHLGAVFTALMAQADADEDLSWAVSMDSTIEMGNRLDLGIAA
jgi:hypothetical protein